MSLVKLLAGDGGIISYRKELNQITGSVTATILLQQLVYWFEKSDNKPFYKFIEPCDNKHYREGDSWTEELGFSKKEFTSAYKKLEKLGIVSKKINMMRVTYYDLDLEILSKLLNGIYVSDKRELTKVTKGNLDYSKNSNNTENTTENTVQREKSWTFSLKKLTLYENLSQEYKDKLKAKCLLADGNLNRYEDFILQLQSKGYMYKDFYKTYLTWDKEKQYKTFTPTQESSLGDGWFRITSNEEIFAIHEETLEMKIGKRGVS